MRWMQPHMRLPVSPIPRSCSFRLCRSSRRCARVHRSSPARPSVLEGRNQPLLPSAVPFPRQQSLCPRLRFKGRVLRDTRIVIEGTKIVAVEKEQPKAGAVDYDLRGLTVLPGWIDAHVHIAWSFGKDGKNMNEGSATPEAAYAAASNAWLTLMAGFTTVQNLGSAVP